MLSFMMIFSLEKFILSLKKSGMLEKTIVLITGDHGEEFYENGFLGHTSSFDDYQTKTVFVLHYPGIKNQTINRITSHDGPGADPDGVPWMHVSCRGLFTGECPLLATTVTNILTWPTGTMLHSLIKT